MNEQVEPLPRSLDLVRDVLDEQAVDRGGRAMGKVDSIVLELGADAPPRVARIEIGAVAAARRLHPVLGRWMVGVMRRLGVEPAGPFRVPLAALAKRGVDLRVDVDAEDTSAFAWEQWLRRRVVGRVPLSGK